MSETLEQLSSVHVGAAEARELIADNIALPPQGLQKSKPGQVTASEKCRD
jgi:hypothetical protein